MADQVDSTATPDQVLAAGGVSRRRRGTSASGKRRSPSSGARRRAPTPEPPKDVPLDDEEEVAPPVRTKKKSRDKSETRNRRSLSSPGEDRIVQASSGDEGDAVVAKIAIADGKVSATETIITESKRVFKVEKVDPSSLLTSPAEDSKRDVSPALPDNILETKAVVEKVQEPPETTDEKIKEAKKTTKTDKTKSGSSPAVKERVWRPFLRDIWSEWLTFKRQHKDEYDKIVLKRNQCFAELVVMIIYCGLGGLVFRFTEGAFESFYKCGVKRVKRNFIDDLWLTSHNQREEDWKSNARRRLMEFENQLHAAHEAGVHSYSGQRSWSFLNAVLYCLTVVTTIGYGHISPSTTTGRAITIVYAIFGIPLFLILLADFGKLFTRGIKFLWAFVRRLYYTGSCRRVRRTAPVQEVWKGVQLVYDFATFRRPSQIPPGEGAATEEDEEASVPLQQSQPQQQQQIQPQQQPQHDNLQTVLPIDGLEPGTPAPSAFEVDDEFNLPISIAIFILLAYIFVGASVYYVWENWGFFESFYFVFISMSTIGFGDFVPQHPMYMMASIVYLVFGLALTSMCINVVQIKLSDSFRQASAKLGATIGLRMAEEEGALTPSPVVEVTDVQPTITKSLST